MNEFSWQKFLTDQGAHWDSRGVSHFEDRLFPTLNANTPTLIDLSTWSGLRVTGLDALKFLQGQVTCDMNLVNQDIWQRGAHCNVKGRALFSFYCAQLDRESGNDFILLMPRPTVELAQQNLKKYAVFSKVTINALSDVQLIGLVDRGIDSSPSDIESVLNLQGDSKTTVVHHELGVLLKLPGDRYLFAVHTDNAQSAWRQLSRHSQTAGYPAWDLAGIRAGMGEVEAQTSGEFLPQLLNFHLTQGISFSKGCYLGQEIVARMEYRGNLKRHLRRASAQRRELPKLNDPVFSDINEQSIGNVISAVQTSTDSIELLAAVTDQAYETNTAYLGSQKQYKLQFLPLPYAITK